LKHPGELHGKTDSDIFDEEHARVAFKDEQEIIRTGCPIVNKEEKETRGGVVAWVTTTKMPLRDPEGRIIGTFGLSRDITRRKKDEEEIKKIGMELAKKSDELERFLYTASHDLRSPLVTVKTFLGYLKKDMADDDAAQVEKDMHYIDTAIDKMATLLGELLEMSRIGRVVNPPVRIPFQELVNNALDAAAGRIASRNVSVTVHENDLKLRGDRVRLAEIWQNLVDNACKFMGDQKEPRLEIGVETRDGEPVFFVRDNGSGIDPRYQLKVFGLFEKLNKAAEGTGIGLAHVKRIVEIYDGRIWLESDGPGRGANFLFTLPGASDTDMPSQLVKL